MLLSTFDNLCSSRVVICSYSVPVPDTRRAAKTMLRAIIVALLVFLVASSEAIKCYECGPVEVMATLVYINLMVCKCFVSCI